MSRQRPVAAPLLLAAAMPTARGNRALALQPAFDVEGKLTLVEQLQDTEVGEPYPNRLVIIPGQSPFTATTTGDLPDGLVCDTETGILSGTATTAGKFTFKVEAVDASAVPVTKSYTIVVAEAGQELPPHAVVDTCAMPAGSGTTAGDGAYDIGEVAALVAVPQPGFAFVCWSEKGKVISAQPTYDLAMDINHSVVASFAIVSHAIATTAAPAIAGATSGGGDYADGTEVTLTAVPNAGNEFVNWTENGAQVSASATYVFTADADRGLSANFTVTGGQVQTLAIASPPGANGTTLGTGTYVDGSSVTIVATPAPGYLFKRWLNGSVEFSASVTHTFSLDTALNLTAEFEIGYDIATASSPADAGLTGGGGLYADGTSVTVTAAPDAGYHFVSWTEGETVVSLSESYQFPANPGRSLVANFALTIPVASLARAADGSLHLEWLTSFPGWLLEESPDLSAGSWIVSDSEVQIDGANHSVTPEVRAILFADLVNFGSLTEIQIVAFLNHVLHVVAEFAAETPNAPRIRNTWGDGLFCVFDHVRDAALFALGLQEIACHTNWEEHGLPADLSMRIGLHVGPVFPCTDPITTEPTYLGAHVILASRIEPETELHEIYASWAFAALARVERVDEVAFDYVGRLSLNRIPEPLPAYRLRRA